MAYPQTRSCTNELHVGATEGGYQQIGKDWGGLPDLRSRPPMPPQDEDHDEAGLFDGR